MLIVAASSMNALAWAQQSLHNTNAAVIVCTSRYWFNYRHVANALSMYHSVKRMGIPDSQIILMLADDIPCNSRNVFPGEVHGDLSHSVNLYGEEVEVDYRGEEVTVENFIRLLSGRTRPGLPQSKILETNEHSNILVYMTGHGGDEFLKFQDTEEIGSRDIADAVQEMYIKGRYHELMLFVDTCQAGSLFNDIYSPNVLALGSSLVGENSYAHLSDKDLALPIMDRFTSATMKFLGEAGRTNGHVTSSNVTMADMFSTYSPQALRSTPALNRKNWRRPLKSVPITDFFGSDLRVELTLNPYELEGALLH